MRLISATSMAELAELLAVVQRDLPHLTSDEAWAVVGGPHYTWTLTADFHHVLEVGFRLSFVYKRAERQFSAVNPNDVMLVLLEENREKSVRVVQRADLPL